jgi:hypothetical protein
MVRLDPQVVLLLDPSEKGNTEMLQRLKELLNQYDQSTFTQSIQDGLTSRYDDIFYAWVSSLYTEIISGMIECENQWESRCGAGIVPMSFQDLEEYKSVWIRLLYARLTHKSDEDYISQRFKRNRQSSDTIASFDLLQSY